MNLDDRLKAVRKEMSSCEVDFLIACSNGFHTLDRPDPVAHLCGYRSLAESFLLVHRDGSAKLYVSPANDAERLGSCYTLSESVATDDLGRALEFDLFKANRAARRVAALGLDALPYKLSEQVLSLAGRELLPLDNIVYAATPRKTTAEIQRARESIAIAEKGFDRLIEIVQEGLAESAIAVELNCFTKSLGADDNFLMLSASPHNSAVTPSSGRKLARGDILLVEFSPSFEGQFSQICRTVSVGAPSAALREKYELVVRAMWAGIEMIRPGVAVSEVSNAIDWVLQSAGYEEYCRPPHMRRRGHGLGSGSVAPGDIESDNHTILEEDMFFVVHPNQYIPEVGYLLCGETVRVTATGFEVLGKHTATLGITRPDAEGSAQCG